MEGAAKSNALFSSHLGHISLSTDKLKHAQRKFICQFPTTVSRGHGTSKAIKYDQKVHQVRSVQLIIARYFCSQAQAVIHAIACVLVDVVRHAILLVYTIKYKF